MTQAGKDASNYFFRYLSYLGRELSLSCLLVPHKRRHHFCHQNAPFRPQFSPLKKNFTTGRCWMSLYHARKHPMKSVARQLRQERLPRVNLRTLRTGGIVVVCWLLLFKRDDLGDTTIVDQLHPTKSACGEKSFKCALTCGSIQVVATVETIECKTAALL